MPFLVEQCDAFQRYMSADGIMQLKQVTLSGRGAEGYEGLRAYLLPQRTEISSVMVIDRHILTVLSRAQDLEIAMLAAREVMDKELGPFNSMLTSDEVPNVPVQDAIDNEVPTTTADTAPSSDAGKTTTIATTANTSVPNEVSTDTDANQITSIHWFHHLTSKDERILIELSSTLFQQSPFLNCYLCSACLLRCTCRSSRWSQ